MSELVQGGVPLCGSDYIPRVILWRYSCTPAGNKPPPPRTIQLSMSMCAEVVHRAGNSRYRNGPYVSELVLPVRATYIQVVPYVYMLVPPHPSQPPPVFASQAPRHAGETSRIKQTLVV